MYENLFLHENIFFYINFTLKETDGAKSIIYHNMFSMFVQLYFHMYQFPLKFCGFVCI